MRLFFGLPIDDAVRKRVEIAQDRLRSTPGKVKWVEPANYHFTLRFIGNVPDAEAERIARAAEGSWEDFLPMPLALRGVGSFPSARRPQVIWIGLSEGREMAARLAGELQRRLQAAVGLPPEPRAFVAHLTIGRVKAPPPTDALAKSIDELQGEDFGEFAADRFVLYESTLTPRGPLYRAVGTYSVSTVGSDADNARLDGES